MKRQLASAASVLSGILLLSSAPAEAAVSKDQFSLTSLCRPSSNEGQYRISNRADMPYPFELFLEGTSKRYSGVVNPSGPLFIIVPRYAATDVWTLEVGGFVYRQVIGTNPLCSEGTFDPPEPTETASPNPSETPSPIPSNTSVSPTTKPLPTRAVGPSQSPEDLPDTGTSLGFWLLGGVFAVTGLSLLLASLGLRRITKKS